MPKQTLQLDQKALQLLSSRRGCLGTFDEAYQLNRISCRRHKIIMGKSLGNLEMKRTKYHYSTEYGYSYGTLHVG